MFTNIAFNNPNWLQQVDYEPSIFTRPVIVRFSFGSRSVLVRLSFVSRCLVVSLSKTERGPNEEQAKNERKSNETWTRKHREAIEDSTRNCHRSMADFSFRTRSSYLKARIFLPCFSQKKVKILQSSKDFVLFQGKMSVISKKNGFKGSEIEKNNYLCSC